MAKKTLKGNFKASPSAESDFYKALRKIAKIAGGIIDTHIDDGKIIDPIAMQRDLDRYSERIDPWARRQVNKMLDTVQRSNKRAYDKKAKGMNVELKNVTAPGELTGAMIRAMQDGQVNLIKSIPREAGQRAQEIALKSAIEGNRAQPDQSIIDELQKELGLSTEVATSRAKLIALTETAKANAFINQSRAQAVGSTHYRWHNSGDGAVRHSHKVLRGRNIESYVFSWDNPPTLDDGTRGNPGEFPRCRCFAEPIFDNEVGKKILYK